MLARYFASNQARFLSVDPVHDTELREPQSWNKYAYVRNNPINRSDPKGTTGFGIPTSQQQINEMIATAPAEQARQQQAQATEASNKAGLNAAAKDLRTLSTGATVVSVVATGASLVPGPHQVVTIPLAEGAAAIAVGADVAKLGADRSNDNIRDVGFDILGGTGLRALGSVVAKETKVVSETLGALVGDAILGIATLVAPILAPQAPAPQEPPVPEIRPDPQQPVLTTPERK